METFETIKNFLAEGGKCLLIENGKPVGVVLTMEEYEKIKSEIKGPESETNLPHQVSPAAMHPIGEAMAKEMNFTEASANIEDINLADAADINLEDLGLDELPY